MDTKAVKNRVKLTIGGANYDVITDNDASYAEKLASEIDAKLGDITAKSRFITDTQAAIILSLEYADMFHKSEDETELLRQRLKDSLADAAQAKTERDALKRELAKRKKNSKTNTGEVED